MPRQPNCPPSDKIRAELNIEKWPAIWQPSKSKNKPAGRTMEQEIEMEDGDRGTSRIDNLLEA